MKKLKLISLTECIRWMERITWSSDSYQWRRNCTGRESPVADRGTNFANRRQKRKCKNAVRSFLQGTSHASLLWGQFYFVDFLFYFIYIYISRLVNNCKFFRWKSALTIKWRNSTLNKRSPRNTWFSGL